LAKNEDGAASEKWHEGFSECLALELRMCEEDIEVIKEYQLSKEAMRIDLVIKKIKESVSLYLNVISAFFKIINIIEFKSETDFLTISDYYKILAYAYSYVAFSGKLFKDKLGHVRYSDKGMIFPNKITATFVVYHRPNKLLKHLVKDKKIEVTETDIGVIYIKGANIAIQIVNAKTVEGNHFLNCFRSNLTETEFRDILNDLYDMNISIKNSYISRVVDANFSAFLEVLNKMTDSDMELFEKEIVDKGLLPNFSKSLKEAREERDKIAAVAKQAEINNKATKIKFAKYLKSINIPVDEIIRVTEVSTEDIEK
jgi:hypothetical protein